MFYIRNCEAIIGNFVFTTLDTTEDKGLTIEWSYKIKRYDEPGKLQIEIYNPAEEVTSGIKQMDAVIFSFGYNGEMGQFFTGYLDRYKFEHKGVDKVLKVECVEQDTMVFKPVSVSYEANTMSSYVIKDTIKRAGLNLKQLELKINKSFPTGYCVYGKPLNEIKKVVKDCESKVKIEGRDVYIYNEDINNNMSVLLDFTSGLLEEPQAAIVSTVKKKKERKEIYTHTLKALALNLIKKNSLIKIVGETMELWGQVIEMEISDYEAEYRVMKINERGNNKTLS